MMLFPQKRNTTTEDPNKLGCDNKHGTNSWVNLLVINVSTESFYSIQMNVHRTLWEELSSRY